MKIMFLFPAKQYYQVNSQFTFLDSKTLLTKCNVSIYLTEKNNSLFEFEHQTTSRRIGGRRFFLLLLLSQNTSCKLFVKSLLSQHTGPKVTGRTLSERTYLTRKTEKSWTYRFNKRFGCPWAASRSPGVQLLRPRLYGEKLSRARGSPS